MQTFNFFLFFVSGGLCSLINYFDYQYESADNLPRVSYVDYVDVIVTRPPPIVVEAPRQCHWMRWGAWNECSSKCGRPRQTRVRRCRGGIQGLSGCCPGAALSHKPCSSPIDDICAYWSGWSAWSSCSTTCGSGIRRKQRDCIGEDLDLGYLCVGDNLSEEICSISEGNWAIWQQWSSCSATCGEASRSRVRTHSCGVSTDTETVDCALEACCDISDWSEWNTCSVSCGSGTSSRARRDCRGRTVNSERRTCVNQDPISEWSSWSPCSVSCGRGVRYRDRSGPCIEEAQESERCDAGRCPYWTEWYAWSPCDVSCGQGTRNRYRDCEYGTAGIACLGDPYENAFCEATDPGYTTWSSWTDCSASCDYGTKSRDRTKICSGEVSTEAVRCLVTRGSWSYWSDWSSCSVSCGGGTMSRQRKHSCSQQVQLQETECNTSSGYHLWSQWSQCSHSCPGGKQYRSRDHDCGEPAQSQERTCGREVSDSVGLWSPCSTSCGTGIQSRVIRNSCSDRDYEESRECIINAAVYSNWSQWSQCSQSCPGGKQHRNRDHNCGEPAQSQERTCGRLGQVSQWSQWSPCPSCYTLNDEAVLTFRQRSESCTGRVEQQEKTCKVPRCAYWAEWAQWGACSASCGNGFRERTRQCQGSGDNCLELALAGNNKEIDSCNGGEGSDVVGRWSPCSTSCGTGIQSRVIQNSCSDRGYEESRECINNNGVYSDWSQWSQCSQSCSGGMQYRSRDHNCGEPVQSQERSCGREGSDIVGRWSPCSTSCGTGIQSRVIQNSCSDRVYEETRECISNNGVYSDWSQWSACSNSCGGGMQYRRKTHSCGEDDYVQEKTCNILVYNDRFGSWSAWTVCSVDCGGGVKTRSRYQECSAESEVQNADCNQHACEYVGHTNIDYNEFTEWSEWSLCSVSCGIGSMTRYKYDTQNEQWPEYIQCDMGDCCVETWTDWSPCCFFEDRNYKFRTQSNICGLFVDSPHDMILCEENEVPVNTCESLMYPDLAPAEPRHGFQSINI